MVLAFKMSLLNIVMLKKLSVNLTFSLSPLQTVSLRSLDISPGEANRVGASGSGSEDLLLLTFWQKKKKTHNMYSNHFSGISYHIQYFF